ncbi:ribose transport system permease protein [Actinoplanes campanulatus]|uniref:Ribose transport system permease protein n=1 Tax=Actinoplanes campanulatus TaxID=113559 RepID=A0A7W5FJP0_9ACTN|nr:ABC transporter permease [Actinoplanes campanulatus]MBB3100841.1 ribose transport system permease protein [Actinoplanes campanulatus]GGN46348.1 sugar ABC transporter permease [Actinoplanes campanulatus]GID41247.1 sugar ABC transporter permease [Actinoplanes campanulatus]
MTTLALTTPHRADWLPKYGVYIAIAALVVYNAAFTPYFLTVSNLRIQLIQVAPIIIVALGMALVIGTEGIDLSVGAVMALAAALIPLYLGYGVIAAVIVSLLAGVAVGLINGALVAKVGLQPIVATLALFVGGRGLAVVISDGQLKDIRNADLIYLGSGDLLGIPVLVWTAALAILVVAFTVRRTVFGRRLLAIGGNRPAAELAGLPVQRVLITVYVLCAVLAAIAGLLSVGRIQSSDASSIGLLIELSAITAVVVGGTPLTGGRVRVLGTVAGAVLMQLVIATMIKNNLPPSTTEMVQAAIILVAVYAARERKTR